MYFPHRTFVSDVSEIPISFPFPELPFSILFPIKNMKMVMVLLFTDRFRPFSSLSEGRQEPGQPSRRSSGVVSYFVYNKGGSNQGQPRCPRQLLHFQSLDL